MWRISFLIDTVLLNSKYNKREASWLHVPYEKELAVLNMVKNGDVSGLQDILSLFDPRDHLSRDTLRQRKYEFVAAITLVTRWAVEGGLDVETAYGLADAYIRATDETDDRNVVISFVNEAPVHFALLVQEQKRKHRLSKPVFLSIEYIDSRLHEAIVLADVAAHAGKNPSYLSTLFKKETGATISAYILQKKLAEAKQLLAGTDMPIAQISNTLAFSTQSYFSAVFARECNETPRQYRKRFFRNHQA